MPDHWSDIDREAKSAIPRGILLIALILVLIVVISAAAFGLRWVTADARGAGDAREKTRADGDYRIAAYDRFYDQCAGIQALEDQIATMGEDTTLPKDQRATNVLALTNQRNTLIRQYNVDARKADTRGNFLASDLPYEIDPTQEKTAC